MAQNITINGEDFQSVPSVVLPKTGGGSASFVDTTDATATSSEILQGYTAYGADGTKLTGTATAGITPAGTISIDDEGTYDVTNYASAEVDIDYSSKVREITFVINRQDTSSTRLFSIYGMFASTLDFSQGIRSVISTTIIAAGESTHSYTIHCPKGRPIIVIGTVQAVGNYDVTIDSSYGECVDVPHILGSTNTAFTKAIYLKTAAPDVFTITITLDSQVAYPESVVTSPLSVTANGTYTAASGTAYNEVTVNVPSGSALVVDTPDSHGGTIREITAQNEVVLQAQKTITPTSSQQTVLPDTGYDGFASVIVEAASGGGNQYEISEITLASKQSAQIQIPHTLGRVPNFALIMLKTSEKLESGADRYRISYLACNFSLGAEDYNTSTSTSVFGKPVFLVMVNNSTGMYNSYQSTASASGNQIMSADASNVYVGYNGSTTGHLGATTYVVVIG